MSNGQFQEKHFFVNEGGLNITDSPFRIDDGCATSGKNYEYSSVGAIVKRNGHALLNSTPDSDTLGKGIGVHITSANVKTVISAQDRKLKAYNFTTNTFTALTEDTAAAGTSVFPVSSTTPAVSANFNTDTISTVTFAGNTDGLYAAYSSTKFTKNGVIAPAGGPFTGAQTANTGGGWTTTGTFRYAISYNKGSTSAEGNAYAGTTMDVGVALTTTNGVITLTFSALTAVDTTKYPTYNIYRSAVAGSQGFTTGDLLTTQATSVTSFVDTGAASLTTQVVPRINSVVSDNSPLPSGTYNVVTTWKRRLVTAIGSTLRISDINLPESWPTVNEINIPSGGSITALGIISFNTSFGNDEYLAVFKERELWVVKGNDYTDFTLSFVDAVGCPSQSLLVFTNGLLTWVDYRGIFAWDGSDKPTYLSKPLELWFTDNTQLTKASLLRGWGTFYRKKNIVTWALTHPDFGNNRLVIKLNIRLTTARLSDGLSGRSTDAIFTADALPMSCYASAAFLPDTTKDELFLMTDDAGKIYSGFSQENDISTPVDLSYRTKYFDLGSPNTTKRVHKVVVRVGETTDKSLILDFWSNYKSDDSTKSTTDQVISNTIANQIGYWDISRWDEARWDGYSRTIGSLTFNLNNNEGNAEGDSFQLQFRNADASEPITIYGFSIYYTEIGMRK
jgi:hypothetical protein